VLPLALTALGFLRRDGPEDPSPTLRGCVSAEGARATEWRSALHSHPSTPSVVGQDVAWSGSIGLCLHTAAASRDHL